MKSDVDSEGGSLHSQRSSRQFKNSQQLALDRDGRDVEAQKSRKSDSFARSTPGSASLNRENGASNAKSDEAKVKPTAQGDANNPSHVIDVKRLRASWVKNRLSRQEQAKQFVRDEDEGVMRLLARHVELPDSSWREVVEVTQGVEALIAQRECRDSLWSLTVGRASTALRRGVHIVAAGAQRRVMNFSFGIRRADSRNMGNMDDDDANMIGDAANYVSSLEATDPYAAAVLAANANEDHGSRRRTSHAWQPKQSVAFSKVALGRGGRGGAGGSTRGGGFQPQSAMRGTRDATVRGTGDVPTLSTRFKEEAEVMGSDNGNAETGIPSLRLEGEVPPPVTPPDHVTWSQWLQGLGDRSYRLGQRILHPGTMTRAVPGRNGAAGDDDGCAAEGEKEGETFRLFGMWDISVYRGGERNGAGGPPGGRNKGLRPTVGSQHHVQLLHKHGDAERSVRAAHMSKLAKRLAGLDETEDDQGGDPLYSDDVSLDVTSRSAGTRTGRSEGGETGSLQSTVHGSNNAQQALLRQAGGADNVGGGKSKSKNSNSVGQLVSLHSIDQKERCLSPEGISKDDGFNRRLGEALGRSLTASQRKRGTRDFDNRNNNNNNDDNESSDDDSGRADPVYGVGEDGERKKGEESGNGKLAFRSLATERGCHDTKASLSTAAAVRSPRKRDGSGGGGGGGERGEDGGGPGFGSGDYGRNNRDEKKGSSDDRGHEYGSADHGGDDADIDSDDGGTAGRLAGAKEPSTALVLPVGMGPAALPVDEPLYPKCGKQNVGAILWRGFLRFWDRVAKREVKGMRRSIFGTPLLNPYHPVALTWSTGILLLDLLYTAFWVPINVAFCTPHYGNIHKGCTKSDLVGGAIYFANMILGFGIGIVAAHGFRRRTVLDGPLVARLYMRHGRFWLDLIASVPFLYLVVIVGLRSNGLVAPNAPWINIISVLRIVRMVRLFSISKVVYVDSMSGALQESWLGRLLSMQWLFFLFLVYQLAIVINFFSCVLLLTAYFEGYDSSWMTSVSWAHVPTASSPYQWYCAVYWMIVTMSTTGFGDFVPQSVAEQVVVNVAMCTGFTLFGVLVAAAGNFVSRGWRHSPSTSHFLHPFDH